MELLRSQDPAEGTVKIFNSFDTDIRHGVPESVCILKINKQPAEAMLVSIHLICKRNI